MNSATAGFGFSAADLDQAGAGWTTREILQQPRVWTQVLELVTRRAQVVRGFLRPLLGRPDLRVVLTGAGTSAFIGECIAPAIASRWNRRVEAVATTDLVACPGNWLLPRVPTLLVSFARSGNSPESLAAIELAQQSLPQCHHLIVTCSAEGALYRRAGQWQNAYVVLLPDDTNDRGFAMTSSFSAMLLAAALILEAIPADAALLAALIAAAEQVLQHWPARIRSLIQAQFERVVYLGAGELKGLAREAALKLLELTDGRMVAVSDTPLGFRHGPKTVVNRRTLVVLFVGNDPYSRQYDLDLLRELRADAIAARVVAVTAQPDPGVAHPDDFLIPALMPVADVALCLPFVVFAQCFALLQSLALGIRPDNPNAAGTVSRVVRGVSIYPLERAP
jgi:tagatose-6-phosphate ketose/aldose isomerase